MEVEGKTGIRLDTKEFTLNSNPFRREDEAQRIGVDEGQINIMRIFGFLYHCKFLGLKTAEKK